MLVETRRLTFLAVFCALALAHPSFAQQTDLTGEWLIESYEDDGAIGGGGDRGDGSPEGVVLETIGNYLGLPLNEAGRLRATSWDATLYAHPSTQTETPTMQFFMRAANANFRWEKIRDEATQAIIGYKVIGGWGAGDRTIWLDGRAHPPEYAQHTWDGFSTGVFENGILKVTTTHIVDGLLRRNRAPGSRNAVMTEYYMRRGNRMTAAIFVVDPAYLEEPYIVSQDFVLNVTAAPAPRRMLKYWDAAEEIPWPKGYVPHYPLGWKHTDTADLLGIPQEATNGGSLTLYPEYRIRMKKLISETPANTNTRARTEPAR